MKKNRKISKYNLLIIAIIIFLVFLLIVNIYVSINYLTVEKKVKRFGLENLYGFYETGQEDNITYSWTGKEAVKIVERKGEIVCIPVGNDRPDIKEAGVDLKITVNNKIKYSDIINSNEWQVISINVGEMKDDYIRIKFSVGDTWKPVDLIEGSTDSRALGVKVGRIYWE